MEPKVSIVILNYNGARDTVECLKSLEELTYKNFEIILVDNNSHSDDIALINKTLNDRFKPIIVNDANKGFAGGNNVGIRQAIKNNSEFILLLNNDTIVKPEFLTKLIEKTSISSQIGIFTPKIMYFSNPNLIWSAGCKISKLRSSGFPLSYKKSTSYGNDDKYCTCATGCCMLINRDVIDKIGFLDEKYFLYLEDTDYSYRVIKSGYKIYYVSNSIIYHKVSSSTQKDNLFVPIYYSIRNRLYFSKKNLGYYYYLFSVYLYITLCLKIIFTNNRIKLFKIIKLAFVDFYNKKMGFSEDLQNGNTDPK